MCGPCQIRFRTIADLQQHIYTVHEDNVNDNMQTTQVAHDPLNIQLTRDVLDETYTIYEVDLSQVDAHDVDGIFFALKEKILNSLQTLLEKRRMFKIQFDLNMQFLKEDGEKVSHNFVPMESFMFTILNQFELKHVYNLAREQFNVRVENFEENGSGLILERINGFKFTVMDMGNLLGGTSSKELPEILRSKYYTLVNVPSHDNLCFKRSILAHPLIKGNLARNKRILGTKKFYEPFLNDPIVNWNGIEFPFSVSQINKFHSNNPRIGLTVFLYDECPEDIKEIETNLIEDADNIDEAELEIEDNLVAIQGSTAYERKKYVYETIRKHIYPLSVTKEDREIMIDLLLVMNGVEGHYCLINNLTGFLKNPMKPYMKGLCRFCLQTFGYSFENHVSACAALDRQKISYPKEDFLKFTKHKNRILAPYFATADFESLLLPVNETHGETELFQKHRPVAYSFAILDWKNELVTSETYLARSLDENVAERMIAQLLELADRLNENIDEYEKEAYRVAPEVLKDIPIPKEAVKCAWCGRMSKPGTSHRHHSHLPPFNFVG